MLIFLASENRQFGHSGFFDCLDSTPESVLPLIQYRYAFNKWGEGKAMDKFMVELR